MQADWEFDIGGDAPIIDAAWSGFIDLRLHPERARTLAETAQLPALADTLIHLNHTGSPVWTAKCDLWDVDSFDALELDADPPDANVAIACYIDLLPHNPLQWPIANLSADTAEASFTNSSIATTCRAWARTLGTVPLSNCRADFIIRRAFVTSDLESLGVTVYIAACGPNRSAAQCALSAALTEVARTIAPPAPDSAHI